MPAWSGIQWSRSAVPPCCANDRSRNRGRLPKRSRSGALEARRCCRSCAPCSIGTQVTLAAAAGAKAFLSNSGQPRRRVSVLRGRSPRRATAGGRDALGPDFRHRRARRCDPSGSRRGEVTLTLTPGDPSWGFLRVFSESAAHDADGDGVQEFDQVGQFADLPHVTGEVRTRGGRGRSTTRRSTAIVRIHLGTRTVSLPSTSAIRRTQRW